VEPGERVSFHVGLGHGRLFQPFDLSPFDAVNWVATGGAGGRDLVITRWMAATRYEGRTGRELWRMDLLGSGHESRWRTEDERLAWLSFFRRQGQGEYPSVVTSDVDLDGDAFPDLIWSSGATTGLLALSGRTGEVLWWHVAHPPDEGLGAMDSGSGVPALIPHGEGRATPARVDLDDDGLPDLVALFTAGDRRWVAAVSSRMGTALWRRGLDRRWFKAPAWTNQELRHTPQWLEVKGRHAVLVAAGTRLLLADARTGEWIWDQDVRRVILQEPRLADLDGSGAEQVVVLLEGGARRQELSARASETGAQLWARPVKAAFEPYAVSPDRLDWPVVTDLDRDGGAEFVVPTGSYGQTADESGQGSEPGRDRYGNGFEVVSGRDGSCLWQRELGRGVGSGVVLQANRFLVGPDVDGDGWREVYAASVQLRPSGGLRAVLRVDATSGRDGRSLWSWSQSVQDVHRRVGVLKWWQPHAEATPLLAVPSAQASRPEVTCFFDSRTGELAHQLADAFAIETPDIDGDGLDDLAFRTSEGPLRQHALRGEAPAKWRRLVSGRETRTAHGDLDGDGVEDFLQGPPLELVSGATGRRIWRFPRSPRFQVLEGPSGDLDGDGVAEVLVAQEAAGASGGWIPDPVVVVSGATGRRIWRAGVDMVSVGELHLAAPIRLGNNQGPGIVLVVAAGLDRLPSTTSEPAGVTNHLWMMSLSGHDGSYRWRVRLGEDAVHNDADWRLPAAIGDLDGDGAEDLVIGGMAEGLSWDLRAYSGTDGRLLWRRSLRAERRYESHRFVRHAPRPLLADLDRDGHLEVVVMDYETVDPADGEEGRFRCWLNVLEGVTGELRWTSSWRDDQDENRPLPLVLSVDPGGPLNLGVVLGRLSRARLVWLNAQGQSVDEQRVHLRAWPADVRVADLLGDGRQGMLFARADGIVRVMRGGGMSDGWQVEADSVVGVLAATGGGPATVVVARGALWLGVSGATGAVLWQHDPGPRRSDPLFLHEAGREEPWVVQLGPSGPSSAQTHAGILECRKVVPARVAAVRR
jgi:hypothetical protein